MHVGSIYFINQKTNSLLYLATQKAISDTYSTHFEIKFKVLTEIFSERHDFLKIRNI